MLNAAVTYTVIYLSLQHDITELCSFNFVSDMFQKYKLKQQWRPIHVFTYGILDRFAGIMLGINNFVRIVQYLSSFARMSLALQNFTIHNHPLPFLTIHYHPAACNFYYSTGKGIRSNSQKIIVNSSKSHTHTHTQACTHAHTHAYPSANPVTI